MAIVYTAIKADDAKRKDIKLKIAQLSGTNSVYFDNKLECPLGCPSELSFFIEIRSENIGDIQKTMKEMQKIDGIEKFIPLYQCELLR